MVASSRTNTTSQNRIPFIKANGFCSKDYPAMNEVAAELKWDLRSQIHPTVTQTASEPPTVSTVDFFAKIGNGNICVLWRVTIESI